MIESLNSKNNDNYDAFAYVGSGKGYGTDSNYEFKSMLDRQNRVEKPVTPESAEVNGETEIELYTEGDNVSAKSDSSIADESGAQAASMNGAAKEGESNESKQNAGDDAVIADRVADKKHSAKKGALKKGDSDLMIQAALLSQANALPAEGANGEAKANEAGFKIKIKELPLMAQGEAKKLVGDLKKGLISKEDFRTQMAALLNGAADKDPKFAGRMARRAKESGVAGAEKIEIRVAALQAKEGRGTRVALKGDSLLNSETAGALENSSIIEGGKESTPLNELAPKAAKAGAAKRGKAKMDLPAASDRADVKIDTSSAKEFTLDLVEPKDGAGTEVKGRTADVPKTLNSNKEAMFDHIAKATKVIMNSSETTFSTMIRPDEVGRIDVKFSVKDGKIAGRMILQNQEAADFFRANVEELRAVFQKANVEMEALDIRVAGGETGTGGDEQFGAGQKGEDESSAGKGLFSKKAAIFEENNASDAEVYRAGHHGVVNISV